MSKPILILGAGGHAAVLFDIVVLQSYKIAGVVSPEISTGHQALLNCKHYLNDDDVLSFDTDEILLVNGLGSLPENNLRKKLYEKFSCLGYKFASIVSENAVVSPSAVLEEGVQVMAGVVIQAGAHISRNTIVNTGAIIDHDCFVGANSHIAPGVTLSGQVKTGSDVHIGTGSSVIQGVHIGARSVISAGAIVTKSVEKNHKVFGFRSQAILNQGVLDEP